MSKEDQANAWVAAWRYGMRASGSHRGKEGRTEGRKIDKIIMLDTRGTMARVLDNIFETKFS